MSRAADCSIPSDWTLTTLGAVSECTLGGTPSTDVPEYWNGEIPWMASGDVNLRRVHAVAGRITRAGLAASNATLIYPPSVAVGLAGQGKTRGTVALTLCTVCTNQSIAMLQGNSSSLQTEFLFHNLDHRYEELRARSSGGGRGGLSKGILDVVPIELPPLPEQHCISKILDTLDVAIGQTKAIIEKLRLVKQGLLHDLLTRGIDANGELRPPQSQSPHIYKDSPLGWIPIDWNVSNVASEFSITSGITIGPDRVPRSNPRKYLRVANVHRERLDLRSVTELEASSAEMELRQLAVGDLLVVEGHASTEEIGRCAMADESVHGFTFQNHLFRLRATKLDPTYGLHWMNSTYVREYWRNEAATSSGLNTINRSKLDRVLVAVPTHAEQRRVVASINTAGQRLDREAMCLEKLKAQKNGLMDDLLTGRVRVTALGT